MPQLIDLIRAYAGPAEYDPASASLPVTAVTADSREVKPGCVFVAIPGAKADGVRFIPDAIAAGASAVVTHGEAEASVPLVKVGNVRLALALFASVLYPRQPAHIAAVTGTDGKTSTAEFFRQLGELDGKRAASVGTLGTLGVRREALAPGLNTTPDPVALHRMLQQLADGGYTHACMEASSHGLHQYRLDGVRVRAAAFTNLTRDHLDYHITMENYFSAKARLFAEFPLEAAVINGDDPHAEALKSILASRHIRTLEFGHKGKDLRVVRQTPRPHGQEVEVSLFGRAHAFATPLVGAFQVLNMLSALGLLAALGEDPGKLAGLLPELSGVPGRLEPVNGHPDGAGMYVDYAHTPAALAGVLKMLRPHTEGRLIVVFGCGGDRDKGKRPEMGRAAAELADIAIVTDDNPRSEDPAAIRSEVLGGAPGAKEVADRRDAIYGAVKMLSPGDVLLVAGKGHETTQTVGGVTTPFDDAGVLREALREL